MKWENTKNKIPIKFWTDDIEEGALLQAENLAKSDFAFKHIAIMPDVHQGYGMPIGGVLATSDVIIPNAVGVDIGCGMCAVQTDFLTVDITDEKVKKILDKLRHVIPLGFKHHKHQQQWEGFNNAPESYIISRELSEAGKQLGTLGGGNHFIEIQNAEDGFLWLMLHSGSRNFGYKIAEHYYKKAKTYCEDAGYTLTDKNLSFLPLSSCLGKEYFNAMNFALDFARANRGLMMKRFKEVVYDVLGCNFLNEINIHHNYAAREKHFGEDVLIHRKGATQAFKGQYGIIPGSMGTPSYITKGLGNPESFCSSSHGAGRRMGRKEAMRVLDINECKEAMKGIVFDGFRKLKKNLYEVDESPLAYKNIDQVMENQSDLVDIEVKLFPIGVLKG